MKNLKLFIFILALSITLPAFASNWKDYDNYFSLDLSSIHHSSDCGYCGYSGCSCYTFWLKTKNQNYIESKNIPNLYQAMEQSVIFCSERKIKRQYFLLFDKNNEEIGAGHLSEDFQPIVPDTTGDKLYNDICVLKIQDTPKQTQSQSSKKQIQQHENNKFVPAKPNNSTATSIYNYFKSNK